jgi:uncharacterized protein YjeT (DUF2065 family)
MKQTFAVVISLVILFLGITYFVLPNKYNVAVSVKANAPVACVQRVLTTKALRSKWLPKDAKQISANELLLDDCTFILLSDNFQNNIVSVKYKDVSSSSIIYATAARDSTFANLNFEFANSKNPFTKISNYFAYKHVEKTAQKLLNSLQSFLSTTENVYGVTMKREILKDSTLIALKSVSKTYPTVNDIYKNIDILKTFATTNGAKETNPPMLNIFKDGESAYVFMVALPIDKWLNNSGNIIAKRMLAGGNILESGEIKGGFYTADHFLKELENFRADINGMSPAIPFQSLITDRSKEADTSKWVTKLYFPVF